MFATHARAGTNVWSDNYPMVGAPGSVTVNVKGVATPDAGYTLISGVQVSWIPKGGGQLKFKTFPLGANGNWSTSVTQTDGLVPFPLGKFRAAGGSVVFRC